MLYMVIESFKPGRKARVYSRYEEKGRMLPEGLHYESSWIEVGGDRCFQIMKTEDKKLFDLWIREWDDLVDFEVVAITASPMAS